MPFATRGSLVWLGMILSGIALGFYVLASWPDTSPQVTRLPYGEVMPKTPRTAAPARKVVVTVTVSAAPDAELTVAEPAPAAEPERAPASSPPAEEATPPGESAYELGAEPLPGTAQAKPEPAEKQKRAAATPAQQAPAAEPAAEPVPAEPPLAEIIIGSAPPSGPE
jgi:hypothetical protein